eukprot:6001953-Pyramimonas_sp.AAC.1
MPQDGLQDGSRHLNVAQGSVRHPARGWQGTEGTPLETSSRFARTRSLRSRLPPGSGLRCRKVMTVAGFGWPPSGSNMDAGTP